MSLKRILLTCIFLLTNPTQGFWPFTGASTKPFSIMLDPSGDAQHTGRVIDDSFERGITLQFAEQLKQVLESRHRNVRIVLTRVPGETLAPLQNANFANRLDVDLYVSIHFYQEKKDEKPNLYLYHFLYNPVTDRWAKHRSLLFYPYDQAHLHSSTKTVLWGEQVKQVLKHNDFKRLFEVKGLYGMPFRPLIGIKSPSLAFEAGLHNKADWQTYVEPIAQGIEYILSMVAA